MTPHYRPEKVATGRRPEEDLGEEVVEAGCRPVEARAGDVGGGGAKETDDSVPQTIISWTRGSIDAAALNTKTSCCSWSTVCI